MARTRLKMRDALQSHRSIRIPRLLRIVNGHRATIQAIEDLTDGADARYLLIHSGTRSGTSYADKLISTALGQGLSLDTCIVDTGSEGAVGVVAARIAQERPDFVLGVGGGRVVDVAKLAAAEVAIDFISIPTQASSDGICSPVAVILSADGRPHSIGARIPIGIVVDMGVLNSAPRVTWQSGLGDLISNLSAVRDWQIAHVHRGEQIDDFACLTAEAAALSVFEDDADFADATYRQKLIRGLILSGIAMEMAGSSRPASGPEHLISHALDTLVDQPRLHGLQVALGTIASFMLRGEDTHRLVSFFRQVQLPVHPSDLNLTVDQLVRAVRLGPQTRPQRSTSLDHVREADIRAMREAFELLQPSN